MHERRKEPRHAADLPVQIKAGKKSISGTASDVSLHGLFVSCDDPPALRQLVQVEVSLPSGSKLTAHTMVVHHGGERKGAGLEFFGKSDRPEWEDLVRDLARNPRGGIPLAPSFPPGGPGAVPVAPPLDPSLGGLPQAGSAGGWGAPPAPPVRPKPPTPPGGGAPAGRPPPPTPSAPGMDPRISNLPNAPNALGLHQLTPAGGVQRPPGLGAPTPSMGPPAPPAQLPAHVLASARAVLRLGAAYAGPERRIAPRVAMQVELRLRTPRSIHVAHSVDISMTGTGVLVADCLVQPGEQVIVNLIQPGTSMSFRRDGVVSRQTPVAGSWSHVAIQFAGVEPMREVLFANFMNSAYAALNPTSGT